LIVSPRDVGKWDGTKSAGAASLDCDWRADQDHVVVAEEGGVLERGVGSGNFGEEGFHLAGGGEGDDEAAGAVADTGPGVRDVAGSEEGVAGVEVVTLVADLGDEFAFEDVEELVLVWVYVAGGPPRWWL
jgi:hypothetical protein